MSISCGNYVEGFAKYMSCCDIERMEEIEPIVVKYFCEIVDVLNELKENGFEIKREGKKKLGICVLSKLSFENRTPIWVVDRKNMTKRKVIYNNFQDDSTEKIVLINTCSGSEAESEYKFYCAVDFYLAESEKCEKAGSYLASCVMYAALMEAFMFLSPFSETEEFKKSAKNLEKENLYNRIQSLLGPISLSSTGSKLEKTKWWPNCDLHEAEIKKYGKTTYEMAERIRKIRNDIIHPEKFIKSDYVNFKQKNWKSILKEMKDLVSKIAMFIQFY